MKALPDGRLPYSNALDCFLKMSVLEGEYKHAGNMQSFYAGFLTQYVRYIAIFAVSMIALDFYQLGHYTPEHWTATKYSYPTAIEFDV